MKWGILAIFLILAIPSGLLLAQSQSVSPTSINDQPIVDRPFRRIFIPESEFPELPQDNLRPLEIDKLPAALDRLIRRNNESIDPWIAGTQGLRSMHAVARLVGADLLCERTRLVWKDFNGGSFTSIQDFSTRERLSPWNLAIENSFDELNSQASPLSSRSTALPRAESDLPSSSGASPPSPLWVFDSSGRPYLQKTNQETWIRWSLRPNSDSKPNRLNFEALIPKTVEGCWILLLPKSARIEQSSVVTRKLDGWEIALARLADWPDKNPTLGTSVANTIENSYWLLEISGQEKVAFTIELGTMSPRGQKLELPNDWGIDRLFSKQTLQYTVQTNELRIIGEWEWNEPIGASQPIRLEIPEGIKLRSVTVNDREPTLGFDGNRIDVLLPDGTANASGIQPNRYRMLAEFLIPWDQLKREASGLSLIPAIRNINGAVLFGTTILQDQTDSRFVAVSSDRGRLDSSRKTAEGMHRLEYSWNLLAPNLRCQLERPSPGPRVESSVRLFTESDRLLASIKLRFSKSNEKEKLNLRIPTEWGIVPNSLVVKPQIPIGAATLAESGSEIQIDVDKFATSEPTLEFQLFKDLESGSDLELDKLPWVSIDNQPILHCLYVEPSSSNRISLRGRSREWMLNEEELTPWQRDSLPKVGRNIIFGTRSNTMPPLVAESSEAGLIVPIEINLRRLDSQWRVENRFRPSAEWREMSQIHVHLPAGYQWYYEGVERLPLSASFEPQTGEWTLPLSNLPIDTDLEDLGSIVAISYIHEQSPKFDLPLPTIRESKRFQYQLDLADRLIVPKPDGKTIKRKEGRDGYIYQWITDSPNRELVQQVSNRHSTLEVLDSYQISYSRPVFFDSTLDIFVDGYGDQIAELSTKLVWPDSSNAQIDLDVPQDWQVTDCFISNKKGIDQGTFRRESTTRTQILFGRSKLEENAAVKIRLVGPKLLDKPQEGVGLFAGVFRQPSSRLNVRIPAISIVQDNSLLPKVSVWFPESMTLTNATPASAPYDDHPWPVWDWTKAAGHSFNISLGHNIPVESDEVSGAKSLSNGLIGRWNRVSIDDRSSNVDLMLQREERPSWTQWVAVLAALLSASMFRRLSLLLWFLGLASWIASLWIIYPLSFAFQQLFVGIAFGGILYHLHRIVFPDTIANASHLRSDRSSIWDPKELPDELSPREVRGGTRANTPLSVLLPWGLVPLAIATIVAGQSGWIYSQDPIENTAKVFDILIPITDEGQLSGTTIYVPEDLLKFIEREERENRQRESAPVIGASKHNLRLDSRSFGFGNIDQPLTSSYDIWISESAVGRPVRIPFPVDSLKLSRFSVDGIEVLAGRFSRTDAELVWFPDRPGRRSVQIEAQVRLRSLEAPPAGLSFGVLPGATGSTTSALGSGDKRSSKVWEIASDVLPVGNAILEVETDGAWAFWISACGRTINPSVGRIVVHLGNKDRISGYFQPPLSTANRAPVIAMPSDPSTTSSDQPVMNTELLLDHEQLIARTVIEYPLSMSQTGEVEIESDSQWLPIGTQWSDASLVDIRTGSTLDRRRYTLRWNPIAESETESGRPVLQKRSIVTTWVPIGDASLRSILFAECRDRRVRQGVLRYSRSSGAIWTLDGISSWIPAINSKDRLDWPELKDPPLATNLRVPLSGGFGVLRRQMLSPSEQLYASNRFQLNSDRIQITTTVKRNGLSFKNTPMLFEVPSGVHISRVISPSGSIEFATWANDSMSYVQIFLDRAADSASEFVVESQMVLDEKSLQANPFVWPEIKPISGWSSPPSFSLSADPCWTIQTDTTDGAKQPVKQGQGGGQLILQTATGNPSVQIQRTPSEFDGVLVLRLPKTDSGENLQLYGVQLGDNPKPWYGLEVSLPRELAASWTSRNPTSESTSLRWNHRLISVDPANSLPAEAGQQPIDFLIELVPESGIEWDGKMLEQIEINGKTVTDFIVANPTRDTAIASAIQSDPISETVANRLREPLSLSDGEWQVGRFISKNSPTVPMGSGSATGYAQRFAIHTQPNPSVVASEFWVERPRDSKAKGALEWTVPEGWKCTLVQINGRTCPFEQHPKQLVAFYPGLDPSAYVKIFFACEIGSIAATEPGDLPELVSSVQIGDMAVVNSLGKDSENHLAGKIRFDAWLHMLGSPSLSKGNANDVEAWRFGAGQLAYLLSKATERAAKGPSLLDAQDFEQGVAILSGLPWSDRNEYLDTVREGWNSVSDTEAEMRGFTPDRSHDRNGPTSLFEPFSRSRLLQTLLPLGVLVGPVWLWRRNRIWLQTRPWWNLILLSASWWLLSGDLWVPCLLSIIAGILVLDTYWMITEQFRRTGTRAPR